MLETHGLQNRSPITCKPLPPVSFVLASGSHVCVWDAQTGKKRNEFFNIIPEGDITAASFDSRMRKLILGTSKGDGECPSACFISLSTVITSSALIFGIEVRFATPCSHFMH